MGQSRLWAGMLAIAVALAASGCAQTAAVPPAASPAVPLVAGPGIASVKAGGRDTSSANTVSSWVIATTNYCPVTSKGKATIAINVLAENDNGNLIGGTFTAPITLTDNDRSGATKLSKTSVTSNAAGTLSLALNQGAIAPFTVQANSSNQNATMLVAPNAPCVNAAPDILRIADYSGGAQITLAGANGAAAPYNLGSASTGKAGGCGSTVVQIRYVKPGVFSVVSQLTYGMTCLVFATANAGNVITGHAVMIVK